MSANEEKSKFKQLIACRTPQTKALLLIILSLISLTLSFAIDCLIHLVIGPTSTGAMNNPYWIGFFFACLFICSGFFVFRHSIKSKPENLFLLIILTMTCFSSLSIDVNKPSWDADVHFRKTIEWTNPGQYTTLSEAEEIMVYGASDHLNFSLKDLNDYSALLDESNDELTDSSVSSSKKHVLLRLANIPSSIVYSVCMAIDVPFSLAYVLSRLIYAILYSVITYIGMRQLKSGKMLYAVIALLPTAVFVASNYGYDYWINAFTLLGGACLVRELQTPEVKITKGRLLLLLGSFTVAFSPKLIYAPVVLICLLLPKSKFASPKASKLYRVAVILLCILIGLSFLLPYFTSLAVSTGVTGDQRGGSDVSAKGQILYIFSHPIEYAETLSRFLFTDYYSLAGTRRYIGYYCWFGNCSWPIWIGVLCLMIFTAITDKSKIDQTMCNWKSRLFALVLFFITTVLIATALYIEFTPVGLDTINGVQPRYIIPLLFCTLVFLSSPRLALPWLEDKKMLYNSFILGAMSFAYMFGFWQVYIAKLL